MTTDGVFATMRTHRKWAVFEHDGKTWLDGRATRWNRSHVCVYVTDPRLSSPYLWVRAGDVKRR